MSKKDLTAATKEVKQIIKVLIVDDHTIVREAFKKQIERQKDMEVVAEATDGIEAAKLAKTTCADIILMDINMPNMDGIQATKKIISGNYSGCIVGLSLQKEERVHKNMLNAGAVDFHVKSDSINTLYDMIRRVVV